ncbi:PC-esterase domain-containing protein 1B-like isoform X2 [Hemicordylus capensis]|uniref:PC-esterase domain-containing protein 1B-like isoform X2 n=1 Tax=Hemicordylus capensis TaxID=884348 RepID=UPI0023047FBA|nr:PC-esterase domain-containing protein 1B-like isoform X2 [Hemicordylus capensis]
MEGLPLGRIHDFVMKEVQQLLHNKFVAVLGDSIHRSVYKDMIYFLQHNELLTVKQLQFKGESFENDCRVEWKGLHNGIHYREVRQYCTPHHLVRLYFITRLYSAYLESVLSDFRTGPPPDVLIVNSCLWDLNRYGKTLATAFRKYQQNLETFFERLTDVLPPSCLVIWNTAMPLGPDVTKAYLEKGMKNRSTPTDVIKANFISATVACTYKFDVLDLHYNFRFLESSRCQDGVHWDAWVHRLITKLLLTHMADAWGVKLEMRKPQGIKCNGSATRSYASPQRPFYEPLSWQPFPEPCSQFPPPRPPPPRLWETPPPYSMPLPYRPPENGIFPFQLRFNSDPDFHHDTVPSQGFFNFENDRGCPPHLEGRPPSDFHNPGPVEPEEWRHLSPYAESELLQEPPYGHRNDFVMRRPPSHRGRGAFPYRRARFRRPPPQEPPFYSWNGSWRPPCST